MQRTEEQRLKYNAYMREYMRKKRGTVENATPGIVPNTPDVLWRKVDKKGPNECWNWLGYVGETGYGRVQINGWSYYAHRVIYNLVHPGVIELNSPRDKKASGFLMHSCDNPLCCNPAHLTPATLKENNDDCLAKNRRIMPRGEDHHRAVFSNKETTEILSLAKEGMTARQISEKLNKKRDSIKSLLYRHKVDKLTRVTTSDEQIEKIVQMRQDGCTQKTIADTMQMNLSTVKSILQRRGV